MLAGQATPDDLKAISALVARQSALAGKLFDEGIASAEKTADTIVDKLNRDRISLGKPGLSAKAVDRLFKQTFQKVLKESTDDILGSIKEQLDERFGEQDDSNKKLFDEALNKLQKLTAKPEIK